MLAKYIKLILLCKTNNIFLSRFLEIKELQQEIFKKIILNKLNLRVASAQHNNSSKPIQDI